MPQNEFIAISPDPCPWFTEGKGWQAVVHGNQLRKRYVHMAQENYCNKQS